jgi:hypothetical protein
MHWGLHPERIQQTERLEKQTRLIADGRHPAADPPDVKPLIT